MDAGSVEAMATEEDQEERQERLRLAGIWLRTQRELHGWTGSDLARRLDVNQVRISAYERGQYEVPGGIAEQLAAEFGMPLLEARRQLGLWVPSTADLAELERYTDPAGLNDDVLISELIRRYQLRTDREIIEVFPRRSNVPGALWDRLIDSARSEIILGGYTNYFFWTERPHFSETLRRKAESGVRVRILVGNPNGEVTRRRELVENAPLTVSTRINITLDELTKLGPVPGIEVEYSDLNAEAHVSRSIFRFDREALVCEHIAERLGHGSLTFHLRRMQNNGPFDQYLAHIEHLWKGGQSWHADPNHLSAKVT
jgi:transcriptional regulator with XRE-family HTH domain